MNVHRRLQALERKQNRGDGVLILPGGGTIVIQMSDPLGLVCAAMRRQYGRISGTSAPASKFDRTLDLLERATDIDPESPPMLRLAWEILDPSKGYIPPDEDDPDYLNTAVN